MIVEHEARIIRQIFDEFLHGKGTKEITRDLNRKLETEKYTAGHIFITLQNEKYKGDERFSLTINQNPLTKKPIKNVGQAPQYYIKNSHPAIVTEEL